MRGRSIQTRLASWALAAGVCALVVAAAGCGADKPQARMPKTNYPDVGAKQVPVWLEQSVYQYTELAGAEPFVVEGFGLVVNADEVANSKIEPGSARYPTQLREYMLREMAKRGVGSINKPGWEKYSPQAMLRDPRNTIVKVRGLIPPGARGGTQMDIEVAVVPGSVIQSLARGELFETDLSPRGGDYRAPGVAIDVMARGKGPIFVNPALAIDADKGRRAERVSLQSGVILDGGYVMHDRPLVLRLRTPQRSLARKIERRIAAAFQDSKTASARDEGIIDVYVPQRYGGNWQHFAGVLSHLYLQESESFVVKKAAELAAEARKPGAYVMDISYCWEGLGPKAIPIITPLMKHPDPDVAFAAARAAAFLGDTAAQEVLLAIAQTPRHKFQINAVSVLGAMSDSLEVNQKIRRLLDSPDTLVRIEAYNMLARNHDSAIFTRVVAVGNEKFVLDIVPSNGPPLVYATRTGMPRIALIGPTPSLMMPIVFTALDNRLTMTSDAKTQYVDIYYRGAELGKPVRVLSQPDLAQVISRLGGEGPVEEDKLDFSYGDVVAMLQSLADSRKLVAVHGGKQVSAGFLLQELRLKPNEIRSAPPLPGQSRPQTEEPSGATSSSN